MQPLKEQVLAMPLWMTSQQIADKLGVTLSSVKNVRRAAKVSTRANTHA